MDKIIEFFKVLSDETRFRIIMILQEKELCVCEMCEILQISQPNMSRNLSKLKDLGMVKDKRQGQMIFYYLNIETDIIANILNQLYLYKLNYNTIEEDMERLKIKEQRGTM